MSKFVTIEQRQDKHQVIINKEDVSNIVRYNQQIYISFLSGQEDIEITISDGEEERIMQDLYRAMCE